MNHILAVLEGSSGLFIAAGVGLIALCLFAFPFIVMSKLSGIEHQLRLANQQSVERLKELRAIHKYYAASNPTVEPGWPNPE